MKRRGFFQACAAAVFGAFLCALEPEPVPDAEEKRKARVAQIQAEIDALTAQMSEHFARAMWGIG